MPLPKVSIIVPVFNVEKYLAECLDSLLAQTLADIEIICGDGGSTDNSLNIIKEYSARDPRVKYITKERSGYGQSMNDCIKNAKGEYIGIVESDDKVMPNTYERLYSLATANNLDWIRGDIFLYYSDKPKKEQLVRESIIYGETFYNEVLDPQTDLRPYRSGLRSWSGIYKRSFLVDNDIWHNETPGGSYQDVGFYLKTLYYAKRVYFVDEAFYMWRQDNPNSSIHYDEKKLADKSFNEWQLNQEYLDQHQLGPRAYASYNYRKFFSYRWTIEMTSGEVQKAAIERARSELSKALDEGKVDKSFFNEDDWYQFTQFIETGKLSSFKTRWNRFNKNNPTIRSKFSRIISRIRHRE